jgi:hypothetical protein
MYVHCGCLIAYIYCNIFIMKSLEDRNNNHYCDIIPLATSFPSSPDLCKVLLISCFHANKCRGVVHGIYRQSSSLACASKLSNVLDTNLLPCYYLLQNLLQLTSSNLSFSFSLFHHITFITKPLHN